MSEVGTFTPRFEMRHRLALSLEAGHVSVGEMADELGVSRNTVGNYLAGRTRPHRAVLRVWALRCGVPFAWLESGLDPDLGDTIMNSECYPAPRPLPLDRVA